MAPSRHSLSQTLFCCTRIYLYFSSCHFSSFVSCLLLSSLLLFLRPPSHTLLSCVPDFLYFSVCHFLSFVLLFNLEFPGTAASSFSFPPLSLLLWLGLLLFSRVSCFAGVSFTRFLRNVLFPADSVSCFFFFLSFSRYQFASFPKFSLLFISSVFPRFSSR